MFPAAKIARRASWRPSRFCVWRRTSQIVRRGERTAVPGLIDILVFDLFLDSSVTNALNRLPGQTFEHDWRRWGCTRSASSMASRS